MKILSMIRKVIKNGMHDPEAMVNGPNYRKIPFLMYSVTTDLFKVVFVSPHNIERARSSKLYIEIPYTLADRVEKLPNEGIPATGNDPKTVDEFEKRVTELEEALNINNTRGKDGY